MDLGTPFGIPLRVHGSFFGLVVCFAVWGFVQAGPAGGAASVLAAGLLAVSVVLHELGHALAARRFGITTAAITLYPFGGIAAIERMPEDPDEETVIALAGPAVNFVLAAVFGALWLPTGFGPFAVMALMNAGMGAFNLVPAFPMDGGRVLRAVLARRMGFLPASRMAVRVGNAFAWGFIGVGLLRFWPSLVLTGAFLLLALRQERERLVGRTWEEATGSSPPWGSETRSLTPFVHNPDPLR